MTRMAWRCIFGGGARRQTLKNSLKDLPLFRFPSLRDAQDPTLALHAFHRTPDRYRDTRLVSMVEVPPVLGVSSNSRLLMGSRLRLQASNFSPFPFLTQYSNTNLVLRSASRKCPENT